MIPPVRHWKVTTFLAGLRHDEIAAPFVTDRPMHKAAGVREAIEAAGAHLLCLPPYSPDLNAAG